MAHISEKLSFQSILQEDMLILIKNCMEVNNMSQASFDSLTSFFKIPLFSFIENRTYNFQLKYFVLHVSNNVSNPNIGVVFLPHQAVLNVVKEFERYDKENKCEFNIEMLTTISNDDSFKVGCDKIKFLQLLILFAKTHNNSVNYLNILQVLLMYIRLVKHDYNVITEDHLRKSIIF
ncbi:uncharacterized protein LOC126899287 isoform X2 [Daktulosphaira vitifoliae]|uniref:uncharacterized protein LOC126899287 isoform X2 n=1 Tax=Daktulosphaira vitifoliae TaxID=58002 RepID=UPI0021AABB4E|nr:uncharacterized protein LOC126899287 isoform X2 [Daktulosphaira vitifoliae]